MKAKMKGFSLRWGLLAIVVGCWLLPLLLTLGSVAYYATYGVRRQFNDSVQASVSNAAMTVRRSVSLAVSASRASSYDPSIHNTYLQYKRTGNSRHLYDNINDFLAQQYRYDDSFLATILFLTEDTGSLYYTFNPAIGASYANVAEYRSEAHTEAVKLARGLDTKIGFYNSGRHIYMVRNIVDSSFKPYAVLVSQLNTQALLGGFGNIAWETGATVYLNGVPVNIGLNEPDDTISIPDSLHLFSGERVTFTDSNITRVYGREHVDSVDILYVVDVDMQGFLTGIFNLAGVFYLLLIFLFPLLGFAVLFFYRNIYIPVGKLSEAATEIQNGNLGFQIEDSANNLEFSYLNEGFNAMSVRLKQQFERIYSEELALRDARIMALQSQINPHFLNNTLEIINWEIRLGNNAKVSKMIEALSLMLDAAMDRKSSPLVTLAQEMMYVDAYLYIISERFGKRLTVIKDVEQPLLQYNVPRLIMQPIIENAVEHGAGRRQSGTITIIARLDEQDNSRMLLGVENDGPMSEKDIAVVETLLSPDYDAKTGGSYHLGIHNVNVRLKMIYGGESELTLKNIDGDRTFASFTVPVAPEEKTV